MNHLIFSVQVSNWASNQKQWFARLAAKIWKQLLGKNEIMILKKETGKIQNCLSVCRVLKDNWREKQCFWLLLTSIEITGLKYKIKNILYRIPEIPWIYDITLKVLPSPNLCTYWCILASPSDNLQSEIFIHCPLFLQMRTIWWFYSTPLKNVF